MLMQESFLGFSLPTKQLQLNILCIFFLKSVVQKKFG